MKPLHPFLQKIGLHPLVAFAMVSVDWMLFGEDAVLGPIGWVISTLVALALTIPCILLQRYAYKDSWTVALGKGILVGTLTAIPTAIPSFITAAGGILGAFGMLKEGSSPPVLPDKKEGRH
ncbi:MAG: hypothetical protein LBH01_06395 [Verrucomicrobiales bacterium]|nr:hypothetical protein [Verrucomicrobiales bacterium]